MLKTLRYFISLISLFFLFSQLAFSQELRADDQELAEKELQKLPLLIKDTEDSIRLFSAIKLEIDLLSPIFSMLSQDDRFSFEGNIQLNLKEKYFPILELGFAKASTTRSNATAFRTKGLFARVGLDYNLSAPSPPGKFKKYALIGARLGFTQFSYDMTNISLDDDYWREKEFRDFINIKKTLFWIEPVFGLRMELTNNLYLGWTARMRFLFEKPELGELSPWYIPGVGIKSLSTWGLNYTIGYRFNL